MKTNYNKTRTSGIRVFSDLILNSSSSSTLNCVVWLTACLFQNSLSTTAQWVSSFSIFFNHVAFISILSLSVCGALPEREKKNIERQVCLILLEVWEELDHPLIWKRSFHPSKLTINTFCSSSAPVPPFAFHLWPSSCCRSSRCSSFSLFCSDCYLDPLSQDPERPPLIVVSYCGIINNNTDFNSSLGSSIIANLGKVRKYWLKRPLVRSLEWKVTNAD